MEVPGLGNIIHMDTWYVVTAITVTIFKFGSFLFAFNYGSNS